MYLGIPPAASARSGYQAQHQPVGQLLRGQGPVVPGSTFISGGSLQLGPGGAPVAFGGPTSAAKVPGVPAGGVAASVNGSASSAGASASACGAANRSGLRPFRKSSPPPVNGDAALAPATAVGAAPAKQERPRRASEGSHVNGGSMNHLADRGAPKLVAISEEQQAVLSPPHQRPQPSAAAVVSAPARKLTTYTISGTSIDRRFIEVNGHGRTRSISTSDAELGGRMAPQSKVPRPAGPAHMRNVSVSLCGDGFGASANSDMRGALGGVGGGAAADRVLKLAKEFIQLCFELPVSRERALDLPATWVRERWPMSDAQALCSHATALLSRQPTLVHVSAPCKVFGDIHGQFQDLLLFFDTFGQPQHYTGDIEAIEYVFIGDFVDRGKSSVETMFLLFCLKVLYPERVWLLRGNHEDTDINQRYGFRDECLQKYPGPEGSSLFDEVAQAYSWMPLAAVVEDRVLCIHGGLGHVDGVPITLEAIARIKRPFKTVFEDTGPRIPPEDWKTIMALLWSDPTADCVEGNHASLRTGKSGVEMIDERQSYIRTFGPQLVKEFIAINDLDVVIRAHECVDQGFLFFAGGRLITVFSARNYAGTYANDAAFLLVSRQRTSLGAGDFRLQITPKVLKAAGEREVKPVYDHTRDVSPCRKMVDYNGVWGGRGFVAPAAAQQPGVGAWQQQAAARPAWCAPCPGSPGSGPGPPPPQAASPQQPQQLPQQQALLPAAAAGVPLRTAGPLLPARGALRPVG
eukprot:TRINITY_DN45907_c0_g1_i1.p1 TRINITY_DN45907_c0_g1~~TRINITY_DN45907_c0_g1_i1.p1  ORF type:complete len:747 (-),score=145.42 TRINITY_DN45907_c0_g1_i1:77-2317(-)